MPETKQILHNHMLFDLKQITSNLQRGAYRMIGSGTGRQVYDLKNGYVAKVAKNRKGVAQNEAEYQISLQDKSGLFAPVIQASADLHVIIMEKAEQLWTLSGVWRYYNVRNNKELYQIPKIKNAMMQHNLIFVDLCKPHSWGGLNGRPVVIDYGFTRAVNRDFYLRK